MVIGRGWGGWRRAGGPFLRFDLVLLWSVVAVGVREWSSGTGWAVVAGVCAVVAVLAAPGPLRPSPAVWAFNGGAVGLWQWVWMPLWVGQWGSAGSVAGCVVLGAVLVIGGRWADRVWWPAAIAARRESLGGEAQPGAAQPVSLRLHVGRWRGAAEVDLPTDVWGADGSLVRLLPGQRYVWKCADVDQGVDLARTLAWTAGGPGPEARYN